MVRLQFGGVTLQKRMHETAARLLTNIQKRYANVSTPQAKTSHFSLFTFVYTPSLCALTHNRGLMNISNIIIFVSNNYENNIIKNWKPLSSSFSKTRVFLFRIFIIARYQLTTASFLPPSCLTFMQSSANSDLRSPAILPVWPPNLPASRLTSVHPHWFTQHLCSKQYLQLSSCKLQWHKITKLE